MYVSYEKHFVNSNILNFLAQSRYGRLTPLAKTLQEDPSCQLCTILQNYVLLSEIANIETNLKESDLPLLSTLRQVIHFFQTNDMYLYYNLYEKGDVLILHFRDFY